MRSVRTPSAPLLPFLLAVTAIAVAADAGAQSAPTVVPIRAVGLTFDAPDEIPAGWTTFRLSNQSGMAHFGLLGRYPEGKGLREHQEVVAPIFQKGMDLLNEGEVDAAMAAFGELPAWFGEIVFVGGPGLASPGQDAVVTTYLEPGTYVLECYVKTDGVFHSYNPAPGAWGMAHEFTVLPSDEPTAAPEADARITVSAESGIQVDGVVGPGEAVVAVEFLDQGAHEHFLGHDVHLARLGPGTDLDALAAWMDWSRPGGLETPAPATFVGGTHELGAGETTYLHVDLEPGRYAWIAEVPDPAGKGMLVPFTVDR